MNRLPLLLLFTLLAAPGIGQMENDPYFALSSSRTFGTSDKPSISISAWNVDELEMRVYRIHDAAQFFKQIEDPHAFGTAAMVRARQRTWLERWRDWKSGLRYRIRHSIRDQFSEPPTEAMGLRRNPVRRAQEGTHYAEIPLLNSQQLVLRFRQPVKVQNRWAAETIPVNVTGKGVYLVEAVTGAHRAYTVLMVSDLAAITKVTHGRVVAFAVDRKSGQPVIGADAALMTRDRLVAQRATDADGLVELAPGAGTLGDYRLMIRKGEDVAVATPSQYSLKPESDKLTGIVYTDRPVYRPGQSVHIKAYLREKRSVGYSIPAAQKVTLEVKDADGKSIHQVTVSSSASGSASDDLELPKNIALGNCFIEIRAGESNISGHFDVQEYKKPEYEVRVTPSRAHVLQGERVDAVIDARYYFGEPVTNAKVQYSIYKSRYWAPYWGDEDADEASGPQEVYESGGPEVAQGEGALDADGKLTIHFDSPVEKSKFDQRYRIEARVTDEARRMISGTGYMLATYGSYAVHAEPDRWFYEAGSTASIKLDARDYENKQVNARVHLEVMEWNETGMPGPRSSADGLAGTSVNLAIPKQGGSYRFLATSRTPEGRDVQQEVYLWVASAGERNLYGGGDQRTVAIVPDKKAYAAGDTARVLIVTGAANTSALVSIEGRDLRSVRVMRSTGSTLELVVPVTSDEEPGFYVSAAFIREGTLYQATKFIKVPAVAHKLNVAVTTDKPQYQPGQTASYNLMVTGANGKAVPNAELSFGVVDEAIYAIQKDATPDILNFFYGREYDAVETDSTLQYYFTGEAGKRRMRLASLPMESRLAQIKPERLVQPKVRKLFPDTAFWDAHVTTDAVGRAKVSVPFPDSLTTWRATVRGMTMDSRAGSTTLKTVVRKNLILRLAVPRFFRQGDEVTISSLVHNYLATGKTVHATLRVTGLDVLGAASQDISVPARGEVRVDWRVQAQVVRQAVITGEALTNEESDALELTLPVNPNGIKLSLAKGGSLPGTQSAQFDLVFPGHVETGSRELSIRVAPTIAGSLFSALGYLTEFPYGCVEQTMSSFLPNIIVSKTVQDLGLKNQIDPAELAVKVNAGLDRLYGFQHADGGWGWWETDESHPFMTAYVVAGLAQAQAAGYAVKPEAVAKGVAWMRLKFDRDNTLNADLRAYFAYALAAAGQPDAKVTDAVFRARSSLSPYGDALLGMALETQKDGRAQELANALEKSVAQTDEEASWPVKRDNMLDFSDDATPEASAFAIKFLSHEKPGSPLLPKAAVWLMNHRDDGYWWHSTKQTAMVIHALVDYLKASHELAPDITATVTVNGKQLLTKHFGAEDGSASVTVDLDEAKLAVGANHIRVESSGTGRVYYAASADYYTNEDRYQRTGQSKLNLLRDYFQLVPRQDSGRIIYDLKPLEGSVKSGDTIAVRLTLTGSDWKYLLIEDPIPAGTEFIEKDNLFELSSKPPWWEYWFDRRELHDDHMAIFQTYFFEGQRQYFYLLKVVNPGVFRVSPARVQPMYQPQFLSATESRILEVK